MGTLAEMIRFLEKAGNTVETITEKLDGMQKVFNRNFNNVRRVRSGELEFLQDEFFSDSGKFPSKIKEFYDWKLEEEEKAYERNLRELEEKQKELLEKRTVLDDQRQELTERLRHSNKTLDKKEERLKKEILELEEEISRFNATIKELNSGFGFLINIGKMKKIEKQKKELLENRQTLLEEIEGVRNRWVEAEKKIKKEDTETGDQWSVLQTNYSLISEKLKTLKANREEIIKKAAFISALQELKGDEDFLRQDLGTPPPPEACKKCGSPNKENVFFCNYCGEPFAANRPDVQGSLVETGELNRIYDALSTGIGETVSLIALFRGLKKGLDTFLGSVKKVKNSEDTYTQLSKLRIDVPGFSADFARQLEVMEKKIQPKIDTLHPLPFAEKMKNPIETILTDKNIEGFFQEMGKELDRRTKEQW